LTHKLLELKPTPKKPSPKSFPPKKESSEPLEDKNLSTYRYCTIRMKRKMWKGNLKSPYFSASLSFGAEGEQFSKIKNKQVPNLRINRTDG